MCVQEWESFFYENGYLKKKYVFPKSIPTDHDYLKELNDFMNDFIEDLKKSKIDTKFVEKAEWYKDKFHEIIINYLKGDLISAYDLTKNIIEELLNNELVVSNISESFAFNYRDNKGLEDYIFYRARESGVNEFIDKDGIKHVPFKQISKIGSNRFSIPGHPCLYLGTTSYVCWLELGKPADNKFNTSCYLLNKDYKILNLSTNVQFFIETLEYINFEQSISLFESLLLSMATSFVVEEDNRSFKSEYIISQLITLVCKNIGIEGISYISNRIQDENLGRDLCTNLVLFVEYEEDNENYSKMTDEEMFIGNPVNYAWFDKINKIHCQSNMHSLPYQFSDRFKIINFQDELYSYSETNFYLYDTCLYLKTKNLKKFKTVV